MASKKSLTYKIKRVRDQLSEVLEQFPDLRVLYEKGDVIHLSGSFPVKDEKGIIDRYAVEIDVFLDFPEHLPQVREVAGRIPRVQGRHINRDGIACLMVPEEWYFDSNRDSLLAFFNGPVRNFFLGQSLVECGKPWPFGERPHGKDGLIEYYGELVGQQNADLILSHLEFLSRRGFKGHWLCPCKSGQKVRNCHKEEMLKLRNKIPTYVALKTYRRLVGANDN